MSQTAGGAWQAGSTLTLTGGQLTLDGAAGAQTVTVSGGRVSGAGRWQATGDLTLDGRETVEWDGALLAGGGLTVSAGALTSRGTLAGGTVRLTADTLDNRGTVSGRQVTAQTQQLSNGGTLSADETLAVQTPTGLDNGGSLLSGGELTVRAGRVTNRGVMAGGTLSLTADGVANGGTLQGRQSVGLTAGRDFSQTADGVLTSGGTVTVTAGGVETAGTLTAQGLQLATGRWRHQGAVTLGGDGRLTLDELDNGGTLRAAGAWDVRGGQLSNTGALAGDRVTLTADTLDNGGTLLGMDALTLAIAGTARNQASGRWLSHGLSRLTAGMLDNQGQWQGDSLTATADRIRNAGQLLGQSALTLTVNGGLSNSGTGTLLTQGGRCCARRRQRMTASGRPAICC
ncbi:Filamentous hemagglutinin [Dickeya solani]|nr:Filamentous hemagglutinin [Dickeya solani]